MIKVLATNITSPLGTDTEQNFQAVRAGKSAVVIREGWGTAAENVAVGAFSKQQEARMAIEGFTAFESMVIRSVQEALSHTKEVDINSPRTIFILSTTKCNVEELGAEPSGDGAYLAPGATARKIAEYLGFATAPIVVCNACISAVTAQILADRLIGAGKYDFAVVCGADRASTFTLAGFLSFKSLSSVPCRPFDIDRLGLNIGEAAATIIFSKADGKGWTLAAGSLDNDAHHISAPSPDGDGVRRVVETVLEGFDAAALGCISAHGTATMFNDQMESKAIEAAGLSSVPVSALKGFYGHTLGAAGALETILTMRALDEGWIIPVRGFEEIGVSGKMTICKDWTRTDKTSFLKIISGFGGCNGALLMTKLDAAGESPVHAGAGNEKAATDLQTVHTVSLTQDSATLDGQSLEVSQKGKALLTELYKKFSCDYPKFYKMDVLSRLVFIGAQMLASRENPTEADREDRAIILFNKSTSIVSDRAHIATIADRESFFPSPSVFLYTLPNIAIGEVAIRHSFKGETSLFILPRKDEETMDMITEATALGSGVSSMLTGWADCPDEDTFEAELKIVKRIK